MPYTGCGIEVTDVDTEAKAPLGFELIEPAVSTGTRAGMGERVWVYVFQDEAATALAVGDIVIRDPSAATEDMFGTILAPVTTPAPAISVIGVAQHVIAAGSYGFVLKKGKGLVKNGTADITADTPIVSGGDRAGSAIDYASGTASHLACIIGMSLEAEATNNTTFDAYIRVP